MFEKYSLLGSDTPIEKRVETLVALHNKWGSFLSYQELPLRIAIWTDVIQMAVNQLNSHGRDEDLQALIEDTLLPTLQTKLAAVYIPAHLAKAELLGVPESDGLAV